MIKNLTVVIALSVLMTACGGSDNKKSTSSSSVATTSAAKTSSAVATSAATSSAVATSAATSSAVATSAATSSAVATSAATSSAVATSAATSSAAKTSSSVATSSAASTSSAKSSSSVASSAASSTSSVACEPNPDSVIPLCDLTNWKVDGGNGGSFVQGESGPIFTNGAPTGTNSWNKPGMFFVLKDAELNKVTIGKTLTLVVVVDQAFKDTGGDIQPVIQENGGSYGGFWKCPNNPNSGMTPGQEQTISCTTNGTDALKDGVAELRLGFQLNSAKNFLGTLKIVDATWE